MKLLFLLTVLLLVFSLPCCLKYSIPIDNQGTVPISTEEMWALRIVSLALRHREGKDVMYELADAASHHAHLRMQADLQ